jgi:hypothetical protein
MIAISTRARGSVRLGAGEVHEREVIEPKPAGDVRAAIIILALMGENNPPHRKSMEHAAKFAIHDSARLLQALKSVRTIEVSPWYGAVHRKKTKAGAGGSVAKMPSRVEVASIRMSPRAT